MWKRRLKRFFHWRRWMPVAAVSGFLLVAVAGAYVLYIERHRNDDSTIEYGVTFSTKYAQELGIDWRAAYLASLNDLQIKHYRIPIYWDDIEKVEGSINLQDYQWMLDRAAEHQADVIIVVGERVPRWPECHPPEWAKSLSTEERQQAEIAMMTNVVTQLRGNSAIREWQVQNEPLLTTFGLCPAPDRDHIRKTIEVVRSLDSSRQIVLTDSGELSTWVQVADLADVLGVSLYRVTWNSIFGYFYYPLPPEYYTYKRRAIDPLVSDVFLSELQAEPWTPGAFVTKSPLQEQYHSMNEPRFLRNVDYARRTGFNRIYIWGIEWWWWLKETHNHNGMWNAAATIFVEDKHD
jgi:hypothetical protein